MWKTKIHDSTVLIENSHQIPGVPSYTTGIQEYPVCQPESRIPPSRIQEYPSTLVDLKSGTLTRSCGQSLGNLTRAIPLSVTQNQKRYLWWKPMAWLGIIRPTNQSEKWHMQQWSTFFCLTLGLPMPWISPGTRCACQKFDHDQYANHALTCNTHGGAAKSHDWAVAQVAALFRSLGNRK